MIEEAIKHYEWNLAVAESAMPECEIHKEYREKIQILKQAQEIIEDYEKITE